MYYFRQDYPFGPPRTIKGKCVINYGGKEIVCENVEVVLHPAFNADAKPAQFAKLRAPRAEVTSK